MAIHHQAQFAARQVRYEYDMFCWSAEELISHRSDFLDLDPDGDLIIEEYGEGLERPFIFEVGSSGYGPASVNAILECFLIHTRVLVDFLTRAEEGTILPQALL